MIKRPGSILALVFTERQLHVAVARAPRSGPAPITGSATLDLPAEPWQQPPESLARALRQALARQGLHGKHAVVGVPARWLVVRQRTTPPASGDVLRNLVRLQLERDQVGQTIPTVADYTPTQVTPAAPQVLIAALGRDRLDWLIALARAAGLKLHAVTSTALVVAAAQSEHPRQLVLDLQSDGGELVLLHAGQPCLLRQVAVNADDPDAPARWRGHIQRALAQLAPGEDGNTAVHLLVRGPEALVQALGAVLPPDAERSVQLAPVATGVPAPGTAPVSLSSAALLAQAALAGTSWPLNWLDSRLSEPPQARFSRRTLWLAAAAAVVVLLLGWYAFEVLSLQRSLDQQQRWLNANRRAIDAAVGLQQQVREARTWYDQPPHHLEALRELTLAFPRDGRAWATSLTIKEDLSAVLSGKAEGERPAIELLERLRQAPQVENAKLIYLREADRRRNDVAFAISLNFKPAGPAVSGTPENRAAGPMRRGGS